MERIRPTSVGNSDKPAPANSPRVTNQVSNAFKKPSLASKVLVILLILASLVFIAAMTAQLFRGNRSTFGSAKVDKNAYQAVFLTNGQVYFGKLKDPNSQYVTLNDIYYLQINQTPNEEGLQPADDKSQPQVTLVKLGRDELHGPQDTMYISRDQVLFWENLKDKDNSQVTKAIEDFKAQGENNQN